MTSEASGRRTRLSAARERLDEHVEPHGRSQRIAVGEADGRVLATAAGAPRTVPAFDRARVAGYAIRAADSFGAADHDPVILRVRESDDGSANADAELPPQTAVTVGAGERLPADADAVVDPATVDRVRDELELFDAVTGGTNVERAGSVVESGETLAAAGTRLRPTQCGLCRSAGLDRLTVADRPRVRVVAVADSADGRAAADGERATTADESSAGEPDADTSSAGEPDADTSSGRESDVSETTAAAAVIEGLTRRWGATVTTVSVPPERAPVRRAIERAVASPDETVEQQPDAADEQHSTESDASQSPESDASDERARADLVVVAGGAPTGSQPAEGIATAGRVLAGRLAVEPGGETLLATASEVPVVGTGADAVAALVAGVALVRPAVRRLDGRELTAPPGRAARITRKLRSQPGVRTFVPVRVTGGNNSEPEAEPIDAAGTPGPTEAAAADGWVAVPEASEGIAADRRVMVRNWEVSV